MPCFLRAVAPDEWSAILKDFSTRGHVSCSIVERSKLANYDIEPFHHIRVKHIPHACELLEGKEEKVLILFTETECFIVPTVQKLDDINIVKKIFEERASWNNDTYYDYIEHLNWLTKNMTTLFTPSPVFQVTEDRSYSSMIVFDVDIHFMRHDAPMLRLFDLLEMRSIHLGTNWKTMKWKTESHRELYQCISTTLTAEITKVEDLPIIRTRYTMSHRTAVHLFILLPCTKPSMDGWMKMTRHGGPRGSARMLGGAMTIAYGHCRAML